MWFVILWSMRLAPAIELHVLDSNGRIRIDRSNTMMG